MSAVTYPASLVVTGRAAGNGAATEVTLQVGTRVKLTRVKILRVSGAAANFTPRIVSTTGAASGSFAEEWSAVATPVATKIDAVMTPLSIQADSSNKLYLCFAPDAGADNVFDYACYFDVVSPR